MKQRNFRIKKYLEEVISIKWLAIGIVFYFYGVMLKKEIVKDSYQRGIPFNNWDITLRLMNDMYLIVYFIIPTVLFFSIKSILLDFDYQILIRLGSFKKWVYNTLKHFWMRSAPLLLLWAFVSLFMMIGFPFSWDWSQLSETKHLTNTLDELVKFFGTPISVFAAQLILLTLSVSLLHVVLATVYVLTKSKYFILTMSVIVFLGGSIGFKILPTDVAFLSPTTYFSIAKGVNTFHSPILSYMVVLGIGVLIVLFLQVLDVNKKVYVQSIKSYIPIGIYFFLCVIGIISKANSLLKSDDATICDVWIESFIGVSANRFAYLSFFFYLIVYFGFIYLVQLYLSNEIEHLGFYKMIRFRNLNKWFWSWMKRLLIAIALFLFTLMSLSLIIAVCFGMNTSFYVTKLSNPLHEVVYHFFINGFLQIVFYIFSVFIVSWLSKESIHGVLLISIFMILMLPGVNAYALIPVGLNSIVYLADYSPYYLTIILFVMNAIAYCVVHYLFKLSLKI